MGKTLQRRLWQIDARKFWKKKEKKKYTGGGINSLKNQIRSKQNGKKQVINYMMYGGERLQNISLKTLRF